ncbi:MAG: hypothetical protein ACRCXD_08735 [Luteolibacter sp.]
MSTPWEREISNQRREKLKPISHKPAKSGPFRWFKFRGDSVWDKEMGIYIEPEEAYSSQRELMVIAAEKLDAFEEELREVRRLSDLRRQALKRVEKLQNGLLIVGAILFGIGSQSKGVVFWIGASIFGIGFFSLGIFPDKKKELLHDDSQK